MSAEETNIVSSCCKGYVYNMVCLECGEHCDEIDISKDEELKDNKNKNEKTNTKSR